MNFGRQQPKSGGITQDIERRCAMFPGEVLYIYIGIAAVNGSVCEDSHTEHM